jgi:hypothetical protein
VNLSRETSTSRWLLGMLVLFVLSLVALLLHLFAPPKPPGPIPSPPRPNAFPELLAAAVLIIGAQPDPIKDDPAERAAYVAANLPALRAVRLAISKPCEGPPDMMNFAKRRTRSGEGPALFKIEHLLRQARRAAEEANNWNEALETAEALLKLSRVVPAHGTFLDHLKATAFERSATDMLGRRAAFLSPAHCRQAITALREHDRMRPDYGRLAEWDAYYTRWMHRDLDNFRGTVGIEWKDFIAAYNPFSTYWTEQAKQSEEIVSLLNRQKAVARLLQVSLALRLFELENGSPPSALDILVPHLLPELPADPFGNTPPRYRLTGTNWLLYSVGPDRVDNRGVPIPWPLPSSGVPSGDIVISNSVALPLRQ